MKFLIDKRDFAELDIEPNQLAVSGSNGDYTWQMLYEKTLYFEKKLKDLGIKANQVVGIIGHKEADYIAIICACIKLNCPYVPMDTFYPDERISKISYIGNVYCIVNLKNNTLETTFMKNVLHQHNLEAEIIYIIFTSGSTGEPKGVQISKNAVLSMLDWMKQDFNLPEKTIFMNQASLSFDLSVYEVYYTLNFGKTLILTKRDEMNLLDRISRYGVNVWVSTPSFLKTQMMSELFNEKYLSKLSCFLFCGEILHKKIVSKIKQNFTSGLVLNTYGPTEATVATTLINITDEIFNKYDFLPIGIPKSDGEVYIDETTSEICIVGPHVMHGYLNRPDLNAEKMFFKNGMRGFRTGDIGSMKDGLLFCHGRIDDQIKLHGYRIELSEIDKNFLSVQGIQEICTVGLKRGEEVIRIIAFVVLDSSFENINISLSETIEKVKRHLPDYMIPSEFIKLRNMPMSANQKIDKNKLLELYLQLNKEEKLEKWK